MAEETKYDVRRGADIYRAIYFSRLKSWILAGHIKRGDMVVWRSGLSGWRKPEKLEELTPFFTQWERLEAGRAKGKKLVRKGLLQKRQIKNILIIDDEKDLCDLLSDALIRRGYNVETANTKRDGIACIKKKSHELVFLDLKLQTDGDRMDILSKINKMYPKPIVNIISAYGSEERREEANKKGAYGFIDKPFTDKEILRSIKAVSRED